jgi:hypothetical protein
MTQMNTAEVLAAEDASIFAKRTGIGAALCRLLREFAAFPEGRFDDDPKRQRYPGFDLLSAERSRSRDRASCYMELMRVRFTFDRQAYTFEFRKHWPLYIDGGPEYYQSGEIRVLDAGQLQCAYNVAEEPGGERSDGFLYTPLRPTTLRIGGWVQAVMRLGEIAGTDTMRGDEWQAQVLRVSAYRDAARSAAGSSED